MLVGWIMKGKTRFLALSGALLTIFVVVVQWTQVMYQYTVNENVMVRQLLIGNVQGNQPNQQSPEIDRSKFGKDLLFHRNGGEEVHHISFLKVHKAASGTMTSILFRYGVPRNLTFVLPKFINSISPTETINEKNIYPKPKGKHFDIMTSHVIYNKEAFRTYMQNDTVYIGILREPYLQFKSSMNYMQPKYIYNLSETNPIQIYLKNPEKFELENVKDPVNSWVNNRQAVEFGIPSRVILEKKHNDIDAYVKHLDRDFDLVIIAEYFDESVVLMKRMLNWKMQDILYRRLHIRGWDQKVTLPRPYDRRLYRKWAAVDYALYDFFFTRLWDQAKLSGPGFFDEVLKFKQVREEVEDFCKPKPNATDIYEIEASIWNEQFNVTSKMCEFIFYEEEDWVRIIAFQEYGITPKPNKDIK
ncbi:hypothetical protein CHS0354_009318 [Potamilus streckersoni]|uniref:Uncharacterized protein n=1 Tax=Potamilus streckersoni TaxID=2493646 RepID=A0AAE0SND1_9BIVA|nr:hypothetical protein CHS0354_009318 [Potamilus streckersoni]